MDTEGVTDDLHLASRLVGEGICQLDIGGVLDWSNYHKVDAELRRIFSEKAHRIIVNLSNAKMITSAGFGCFIEAVDVCLKNGGNIIFVRVPRDIQDVFQILGLSRLLTFAETEQQALAKFAALPSTAKPQA